MRGVNEGVIPSAWMAAGVGLDFDSDTLQITVGKRGFVIIPICLGLCM